MSCLTAAVHVALGRLCHALSWSWVGRNFHACNEASWAGPSSAICPWPKLSSSTACLKISFLRSFESIDLKNNTRQIFNFPKHVCFWPLSGYHMASRLPLYILILSRPGHWDIDYSLLVWKKNGFGIINSRIDRCATRGHAVKVLTTWFA